MTEMSHTFEDGTEKNFMTKIYSGKYNFNSAHKNSKKQIDIKAWFMPNIPLDTEY